MFICLWELVIKSEITATHKHSLHYTPYIPTLFKNVDCCKIHTLFTRTWFTFLQQIYYKGRKGIHPSMVSHILNSHSKYNCRQKMCYQQWQDVDLCISFDLKNVVTLLSIKAICPTIKGTHALFSDSFEKLFAVGVAGERSQRPSLPFQT